MSNIFTELGGEVYHKAEEILIKAKTDENFHENHSDNLVGMGDSSAESMTYEFDLPNNKTLYVNFTDFSVERFSIE